MFNSFDLRVSKQFKFGERTSLLLIGEVFNLFNTTNILGVSNTNYSGYANVLVRDSNTPEHARISAVVVIRCAGHDRGRGLRIRRPAGIPARC